VPTPSKFTDGNRKKILEALQVGASRRTAAAVARIGEATLRRWMEEGREAKEGSRFHKFYKDVLEAEAHPRMRALGVIYNEMDNPGIAWKFIERREPGFAPPMPSVPTGPAAPVMIQLSFHDGEALAAVQVIEGEFVEQDQAAGPRGLPSPSSSA
jgi:hypothetical protein